MGKDRISHGTVHKLPVDLKEVLSKNSETLMIWEDLSSLARNEWICWIISVKKDETRKEHL